MKAMKLQTPIRAALHAHPPANLAILDSVPGLDYRDNTVTFTAANFRAAYTGLWKFMRIAATGYQSVMVEMLRQQPGGSQIQRAFSEKLMERWLDFESGRWSPPPPIPFEVQIAGKKFHGDN
jgi:hypothetical protein